MPRVIHFDVHASDPQRAIKFYGDLFGWKFEKYDGPMEYWLIATGMADQPGINGGLVRRMGLPPAADAPVMGYPCTLDVTDVDKTVTAIEKAGGTIAFPKHAIPGLAWLAYAKDTEGNVFGIYQADPSAK